MNRTFIAGFFAGALPALLVAWLVLHRAGAEPPPQTPTPENSSPKLPDSADANDLAEALRRIASLEKDLAALQAKSSLPVASRRPSLIDARLAQYLRLLQSGNRNDDPEGPVLFWRLQLWLEELAAELRLDPGEARRSPEAWLKFRVDIMNAWDPPLSAMEAAKFEDARKAYLAAWEDYMKRRDSMMGVERSCARDLLEKRFNADMEGCLDEAHLEAYYATNRLYNDAANEPGRGDTLGNAGSEEEFRTELAANWSQNLGLRPEQESRLAGLVGDYIRAVEEGYERVNAPEDDDSGPGFYVSDANGVTIEDEAMMAMQRRMASELGLDAEQIGRLKRWDTSIRVQYSR